MARALKWILGIVLALILLVVIAVIAIIVLVDPNDYRDDIARIVEQQTGRELTIEGDLKLTFFPWLGLETGAMRLADDAAFGDQPFAAVDRVRFAVKLLPLLSREIELDRIVVEGLELRAILNEEGVGNWESLVAAGDDADAAEEAPAEPEQPQDGGAPPIALAALGGLELRDAYVLYEDRAAGARYEVAPLNLEIAAFELGQAIPVEGDWVVTGTDLPRLAGEISSRLRFDPEAQQFALEDLALNLLGSGEPLPAEELPITLAGTIHGDLQTSRFSAPELQLRIAGVPATASVDVQLPEEGVEAQAQLDLPAFNPRELAQRLNIELPEMADPTALTRVALQTALQYGSNGLRLHTLRVGLDDTTLEAQAAIGDFDPVQGEFQVAIDAINVDRYLPPETEEEVEAATPATATAAATELPLDTLRGLALNGTASIGELQVAGMKLTDISAQLESGNGVIRLNPIVANLYEGSYRGESQIDVRGEQPVISVNETLSGIQAGPLQQDMMEKVYVTGAADITFRATMQGMTVDDWLQSAVGEGAFRFRDGAVNGINIAAEIRKAQARLKKQEPAQAADTLETDFAALSGTLALDKGVARNPDLLVESPLFRITGKGEANVLEQTLDYLVTVNLVQTLTGQGGESLEELNRIPIPVRITGSFAEPDISIDLAEAIRQSQGKRIEEAKQKLEAERREAEERVQRELEEERQKLQERIQRERQELDERVKEQLGDKLKGLFN